MTINLATARTDADRLIEDNSKTLFTVRDESSIVLKGERSLVLMREAVRVFGEHPSPFLSQALPHERVILQREGKDSA